MNTQNTNTLTHTHTHTLSLTHTLTTEFCYCDALHRGRISNVHYLLLPERCHPLSLTSKLSSTNDRGCVCVCVCVCVCRLVVCICTLRFFCILKCAYTHKEPTHTYQQ